MNQFDAQFPTTRVKASSRQAAVASASCHSRATGTREFRRIPRRFRFTFGVAVTTASGCTPSPDPRAICCGTSLYKQYEPILNRVNGTQGQSKRTALATRVSLQLTAAYRGRCRGEVLRPRGALAPARKRLKNNSRAALTDSKLANLGDELGLAYQFL